MNPLQQQKFNTVVGGLLIGAGVVAWLIALFFAVLPNKDAPAPVTMEPFVNMASCEASLRTLGYQVDRRGPEVEAHEPFGADVSAQLTKASVAWSFCQVPVQTACIGEGCDRPGITLVLRGKLGEPRTQSKALADEGKKPTAKAAKAAPPAKK